jgi:uncharacterized protein Yka (UPF0111/DUF47 family)
MGFIEKYILPETLDFDAALQAQAAAARQIVQDLHDASLAQEPEAFAVIRRDAEQAIELKNNNMQQLLSVFLTPYDKESIYRLITQLAWVVLSVKHFVIEREVYGIDALAEYRGIFSLLRDMAALLDTGVGQLGDRNPLALTRTTEQILERYDQVVESCARAVASLFQMEDCRDILRHRDIVDQLREIAKRLHVAANTLEDMAIKRA